jgi:hypothetical protein
MNAVAVERNSQMVRTAHSVENASRLLLKFKEQETTVVQYPQA